MLKSERHDAITQLVNKQGAVTVREASQTLHVSEMTLRRDLDELAELGKVVRVHGGAKSVSGIRGLVVPREFTHREKRAIHTTQKAHVAKLAASLIKENDTVFLGAGTTIELITERLPKVHIRVITNSLPVFNLLENRDYNDLYLVGGNYRPHTGAFVGPMAEGAIGLLGIDKAFIGANGVFDHSISTSNMEEGKIQQLVFDKADQRFLVADSSKFGRRDFYGFYDLSKIDGLITDASITPEQREVLEQYTTVIS